MVRAARVVRAALMKPPCVPFAREVGRDTHVVRREDVEGDIWAVGVEVERGVAMDMTVGEGEDPDASSAAGSGDPGRCAEHGARPRTH